MEHVTDNVLARYALDPLLVRSREEVDGHLLACEDCQSKLADIRLFDEGLTDADTWRGLEEDDEASRRFGELRQLAATVASEDTEAKELLAEFDDAPAARFVWADLPGRTEFHTGGVVRLLCKKANGMCERDPRYALALADVAIAIAAILGGENYPSTALHDWRGEAWKERANALHHLGQFRDALNALDQAEAEYDHVYHSGMGHVAVLYVRAAVLYEQEDYGSAERLIGLSVAAALHLGAVDRFMRARHLLGQIHFTKGEIKAAAALFGSILRYGEGISSPVWIARESLTLGNCYLELGALQESRNHLQAGLGQFTALGFDTEVTRTQWAIARLSFAEGAQREGIQRLRQCIAELTRHYVFTDAAIAAVHLAEMLHIVGRDREIPALLNGVVQTFTQAGKVTGALTALAFLKEAATAGRLTKALASHVRRFLSRTDHQPDLLFTPPPTAELL